MWSLPIKKIILFSSIMLYISSFCYSQNKEEIQIFFKEQSANILALAHENSTLKSSEVEVTESDDSEFDYKVIMIINYKGFFKNHILKCYIYFEDYPREFIWGTDTNSFDINNSPEVVLEDLKDKWSKYGY